MLRKKKLKVVIQIDGEQVDHGSFSHPQQAQAWVEKLFYRPFKPRSDLLQRVSNKIHHMMTSTTSKLILKPKPHKLKKRNQGGYQKQRNKSLIQNTNLRNFRPKKNFKSKVPIYKLRQKFSKFRNVQRNEYEFD